MFITARSQQMLKGRQQIWHNSAKGYLLNWRDGGTFLGDEGWRSYSTSARDTLGKVRGSERGIGGEWGEGGAASPSPSPLLCPLYPPVDPTSIPLQFLSTSGWPLKEIGFKLWHELAPQIDLILPHPGDKKRRPTFLPPFLYPPFTSTRFLSPLPLHSTSFVLPFLILSSSPSSLPLF